MTEEQFRKALADFYAGATPGSDKSARIAAAYCIDMIVANGKPPSPECDKAAWEANEKAAGRGPREFADIAVDEVMAAQAKGK